MTKLAKSVQIPKDLLNRVNIFCQNLSISRNQAVEEGLILWVKQKEEDEIKKQLQKASYAVRKNSLEENQQWESTSFDGLND